MSIGYLLFFSFIIAMLLATRLKHKVTRIFATSATAAFFIAMLIVSLIPSTEVSVGSTTLVASLVVIGFVFTVVALVNVFFQNSGKKK